jgi:hypothetical protein
MADKKKTKRLPVFFEKLIKPGEAEGRTPLERTKEELKKIQDKISYLKQQIAQATTIDERKELRRMLIDTIKNKHKVCEFYLVYDSFAEGLEPVYFWILDFMRGPPPSSGIGYEVNKTKEDFEASVGSAFFGEMGTRGTKMQEQAMKMMATINTVIRSMINLLYDLREFDIRLQHYNDVDPKKQPDKEKREAAELALKGVWMDQVDIKRGRGSINMMAQQLQFVTLRDAFLVAKSLKDIDKMDLNERVKRVLKQRLGEYLEWRRYSEDELRRRYNIEKAYLKSQINSLKKYAEWTKPYLIAADKLGMKDFRSPDLVAVFNNMQIELTLLGQKKVDIDENIYQGNLPKNFKTTRDFYTAIEVDLKYRAVPHTVRQTGAGTQYTMGGTVDIKIKAYSLSENELKELKIEEEKEKLDLIDGMVGVSLREIEEEAKKYFEEEKKEEEVKKRVPREIGPFGALFQGFGEVLRPLFSIPKAFGGLGMGGTAYKDSLLRKIGVGEVKGWAFVLYDVYKKAHQMLSW